MKARIDSIKNSHQSDIEVNITEPKITTIPPWGIVTKGMFSVVVYNANGRFKEVVERTALPMAPMGAWSVWSIKYDGHRYVTMPDSIYGYLDITEGRYGTRQKGGRLKEPSILMSDLM